MMSPRGTNIAVACVAGPSWPVGVFIGVRGLSNEYSGPPGLLPEATVPRATAPLPATGVIETVPVATLAHGLRPNPEDSAAGERSAVCPLRYLDGLQLIGSAAGTF